MALDRSGILRGTTFAFAGLPHLRSREDLIQLIHNHGGRFSEQIDASVRVLLSTEEMALVYHNPYKMQFLGDFQAQVEAAVMHKIPIVDDSYLDDCLRQCQILAVDAYVLRALTRNVESKFQVRHNTPSQLEPALVKLLFDQKAIDRSLVDLGVDVRKIQTLKATDIKAAYSVLRELEVSLSQPPGMSKQQHEAQLDSLSKRFYNLIPHAGAVETIKSVEGIKDKAAQLDALTDIEVAQRLMQEKARPGNAEDLNMNPLDVQYRKLRAEITPLESYRAEYKLIGDMLRNSDEFFQGRKLAVELKEVFEVKRDGENETFAPRLANYIGLLSQGVRIAPPEAPVTGYFLGKGAYFADCVSVSAQYCRTTSDFTEGLLLVCEVAMGRMLQIAHGKLVRKDDLDRAGFHSLKCVGVKGPDSAYDVITPDGLVASVGREGPTGVPVSELVHSEYVVYDAAQVRIRYLVRVAVTERDPTEGN